MKRKSSNIRSFHTKLVGVTFRNNNGTKRQQLIKRCKKGQRLRLVRDNQNPVDENAIAVYTRRRLFRKSRQLGHLSADLADELAPLLDAGVQIDCVVTEVTGGGGHLWWKKNYGLNVLVSHLDKCD